MSTASFGPDESMARNKQNVLIAESCQHLKDTASLRPYQSYADAAMKLLGYHVRYCSLGAYVRITRHIPDNLRSVQEYETKGFIASTVRISRSGCKYIHYHLVRDPYCCLQ
jgi:hypothetical protein